MWVLAAIGTTVDKRNGPLTIPINIAKNTKRHN